MRRRDAWSLVRMSIDILYTFDSRSFRSLVGMQDDAMEQFPFLQVD